MSVFVGLPHEVPCDFERMASLSVFSGCCNLCLRPSCQPSDRHADVNNPLQKPEVMCARQLGLTTKSRDISSFLKHAAPGLTPPACVSFPHRSLHNPPGGKAFRVFAVI